MHILTILIDVVIGRWVNSDYRIIDEEKEKIEYIHKKQSLRIKNKLAKLYKIHYVIHYHINCYHLVTNVHCTYLLSK